MLAIITKMNLTQISTWFANARRRLKNEAKSIRIESPNDVKSTQNSLKRRLVDEDVDGEENEKDKNQIEDESTRKNKKTKIWSIVDVVHDQ